MWPVTSLSDLKNRAEIPNMSYEQHSSALQAVIADYFRGIYEGDIETLRRVFHPQAQLFGDIKGQPYHRTLPDYLEAVRARKSPAALGESFQMRILSIECINGIASARLHCPMLGFNYHDVLALNFIEGRWQVVSKLFTHAD